MAESYNKKKKDLASKGMPDPKVGKNVTSGDKKAEMGKPMKINMGSSDKAKSHIPSYLKRK